MYVNKYLLIALGLIITIFLILFVSLFLSIIWSISFWIWYFNKKDYTKEEIKNDN